MRIHASLQDDVRLWISAVLVATVVYAIVVVLGIAPSAFGRPAFAHGQRAQQLVVATDSRAPAERRVGATLPPAARQPHAHVAPRSTSPKPQRTAARPTPPGAPARTTTPAVTGQRRTPPKPLAAAPEAAPVPATASPTSATAAPVAPPPVALPDPPPLPELPPVTAPTVDDVTSVLAAPPPVKLP